ncbi:MAG: hypothetical protein H6605_06790 [Flavobacteriales bacterium]|nr:hypothetical protein [Flavobacteriales bacterium]
MNQLIRTMILLTMLLLGGVSTNVLAQGCSDAGFCTAGSVKPDGEKGDEIRSSIEFNVGYAIGEQGISIITPQFQPEIKINNKSIMQIKVPWVIAGSGKVKANGLGDVIITYNYQADSLIKMPVTFTLGLRIATSTSSQRYEEIPLPMPYQSSLGTTDLIAGIKFRLKKGFNLAFGFQMPMVNGNQNSFDSAAFYKLEAETDKQFFISSGIKRKPDLMMRLDKSFFKPKMTYTVGVLPIYHLGEDKVISKGNKEETLKGSGGLTLNLTGSVVRKLNEKSRLSLSFGAPMLVRESRPDGLTRAFVGILGYKIFL